MSRPLATWFWQVAIVVPGIMLAAGPLLADLRLGDDAASEECPASAGGDWGTRGVGNSREEDTMEECPVRPCLVAPAPHLLGGPGGLPLGVPGHDHVALVVEPATLGQGQFHLRLAVAEVQLGRNEGQ